ncbi:MAG: cation:proton antiporter [Candidatus Daviesbacteria bacterium]|nr:cation:proton antiporter [Candidatus Daviesbacteria bacterium]
MASNSLFIQLAIVLGLSSALGFIVRIFKFPLVVAYLVAGVVLSLFQIFNSSTFQFATFLPDIGVAFVLFFIGMELDLKELKSLGKPIAAASLGQILFAFLTGFLISTFLGYSQTISFYLGAGLSFSSTIVVVKMLLEKKDLGSLYGKLSIGILLVEDLVAIMVLMAMTVSTSFANTGLQSSLPLVALVLKGILLFVLAVILSHYVLTKIFNAVAKSAELLFLTALAWCFIYIVLAQAMGFSVVIGAFLAGIALANSPFHYEIQGKVKPLRDFFVTLFFVYLGSQVMFSNVSEVLPIIILFTLYAIVLKPLIFLLILGSFGFRKHTMFQTAINLSQVSEFSLIIMVVGVRLGIVPQSALTAMALVGVISIIFSSIMISYSRQIYEKMSGFVGFFEHSGVAKPVDKKVVGLEDHVVLIGAKWMGGEIVKYLKREGIPFLVVDIDPDVVKKLVGERVHVLFGDIGDPEVLEFLDLHTAKLIISTTDSSDDNLVLVTELRRKNAKAAIVIRASDTTEAEELYKAGADYVILPDVVSGDFVTQMLRSHWPNMDFFKDRSKVEINKLSRKHTTFN